MDYREVSGIRDDMRIGWKVADPEYPGTAAREMREKMTLRTVENIERFLNGKRPLGLLDPGVRGEAARHDGRIG